jgi:hypothetical protein
VSEPEKQKVKVATNAHGEVHMTDRYGAPVTVAPGDVQGAIDQGFQLESPETVDERHLQARRGTTGQGVLAAAEGAMRGIPLVGGLLTEGAAALGGEDYRRAMEEREEANPHAALAGEVGGALGSALLTGGAGEAAEGLEGAEAAGEAVKGGGILSKIGRVLSAPARAEAGLGEWGGEAAQGLASRLGVTGGFGQGVAKALGAGALEGGAYGASYSMADSALEGTDWTADRALAGMRDGALYGMAGSLGAAALERAGKKIVSSMTEGRTLKQAAEDFADGRAVKSVVGNDVRTFRKLTNDGEDMGRLGDVAERLREENIPLEHPREARQALDAWKDRSGKGLRSVADELDGAGVRANIGAEGGFLERLDGQLAELRASNVRDTQRLADVIERKVAPLRAAAAKGEDVDFSRLWKDSQEVGKLVSFGEKARRPSTTELRRLYGNMRETLDQAVESAGPELATKWKAAANDYAMASTLSEGAKREAQRQIKNRFISPSDYGVGAMTGNLLGTLTGLVHGSIPLGALTAAVSAPAVSMAHKFLRERGSAALMHVASHVGETLERIEAATKVLTEIGPSLSPAAAGLHSSEEDYIGKGVGRRAALSEKEANEQFASIQRSLADQQVNPTALIGHVQRAVGPAATQQPEVATAMAKRVGEDRAWLQQQMPEPHTRATASLTPNAEKFTVTPGDKKKIVAYARALTDPVGVLERAASGHVDWDGIKALKERRPELWDSMRMSLAKKCASRDEPLPYRRRILLSLAFDFKGDASMNNIAAIQASGMPAQSDQGGTPPEQSGRPEMKALSTNGHSTPYEEMSETGKEAA